MSDDIKIGDIIYREETILFGYSLIAKFEPMKVLKIHHCNNICLDPEAQSVCNKLRYRMEDKFNNRCGINLKKYNPIRLKLTTRTFRS